MNQQIQTYNRLFQKKLYFIVQSSNKHSGIENHYSIEDKSPEKVVKQTPLQTYLRKKIKSKEVRLSEQTRTIQEKQRELQKVYKKMEDMASGHEQEYQKLRAQQIALTYWLQQKHKQIAQLNHKYEQLKQSVTQKPSQTKIKPQLTITTRPSYHYSSSQTLTTSQNPRSHLTIINGIENNNPQNMSEYSLLETENNKARLEGLSEGRGNLLLDVGSEMRMIKKYSSEITAENGRGYEEQQRLMTRSARGQKTDYQSQNTYQTQPSTTIPTLIPSPQTNHSPTQPPSLKSQPQTSQQSLHQHSSKQNSPSKQKRKHYSSMKIFAMIIVLVVVLLLLGVKGFGGFSLGGLL